MKKTTYIMAIALTLCVSLPIGCTKDKGSYDYREILTAEIVLPSNLTVEQFTNFRVEPQIEPSDPKASFDDFEYLWYLYPENSQYIYSIDTLSRERILNVPATFIVGNYYLEFKVINKETKTYNQTKTLFRVINEDNIGYMLLSSINGDADVTFVSEKGKITKGIIEALNGRKIGKNPVRLNITQATNYFVWILCDDEEAGGGLVLDGLSLSILRTYEEMFMFRPEKVKPQIVYWEGTTSIEITVNDGALHYRWERANYPIEFYDPKRGNYYIDNFLFGWSTSFIFVYDKIGKRFLRYDNPSTLNNVEFVEPDADAAFDPRNVGMDMLEGYMCGIPTAKRDGRAILKDASGNVHLLSFYAPSNAMTPERLLNVGSHSGINQAKTFAIKAEGEFAYYGVGNQIHVSSFVTGNYLGVVYDQIPSGLTIDCMRVDRKNSRNELWVAASNGSENADSGSFFIFDISSDGTLSKKAEYLNCCGKVVDILFKNR